MTAYISVLSINFDNDSTLFKLLFYCNYRLQFCRRHLIDTFIDLKRCSTYQEYAAWSAGGTAHGPTAAAFAYPLTRAWTTFSMISFLGFSTTRSLLILQTLLGSHFVTGFFLLLLLLRCAKNFWHARRFATNWSRVEHDRCLAACAS